MINELPKYIQSGNLYDLIIFDEDGDRVHKFSYEYVDSCEIVDEKLLVYYFKDLYSYPLDRYEFAIQGR